MNTPVTGSAHARIAPSALHLTIACPGSVMMQEQAPPLPPDDEELEGQAAHLVAMGVASKQWEPKYGDKFMHAGRSWEIDDDMLDGASMYAEEAQFHAGARYEDAVDAREVIPECWGTPDYWRVIEYIDHETGVPALMLKNVDYKYGHRYVEVFEIPQLIAYALGVQQRLQLAWNTRVCLTIVQPRAFHHEGPVREWRQLNGRPLALIDLWTYANQHIVPAVNEALSDSPRTIAGPHCVDCKAKTQCPTFRRDIANVLRFVGTSQPEKMSPQAVGVELRLVKWAIKMLEGREAGLRAHAEAAVNAGLQIPYWKMEPVVGRLRWNDGLSAEDIAAMGDLLGFQLRKPLQLITPTNAIRGGIDRETIEAHYASRPKGGKKLVPDDEIQFRKIFGHISK